MAAALAAAEAMADLASPGAKQQTTPATGGQRRQRDSLQEERRRQAVVYKYEQLGRPQQEIWHGLGGTVAQIRAWLGLSAGADCRTVDCRVRVQSSLK